MEIEENNSEDIVRILKIWPGLVFKSLKIV